MIRAYSCYNFAKIKIYYIEIKPSEYWNEERYYQEARKYKTKTKKAFCGNSGSTFIYALRNGCLNTIGFTSSGT